MAARASSCSTRSSPYDTAFHVGLTRELTLGYPPQVPGVAGFPLGYHLGTDLVRAAALRWAAVDPYDSITRFDVTAVRARAAPRPARGGGAPRPLRAGRGAGGLDAPRHRLLVRLRANPQAHWWADLLRGNLLLSLFLANPVSRRWPWPRGPGRAVARHGPAKGRGWSVVAAVLAAAVPFFKVFLGAHLALGLLAPRSSLTRRRAWPSWRRAVAVPPRLALVLGQGGQTVAVDAGPARPRAHHAGEPRPCPDRRRRGLPAGRVLWLVASLGLRVARHRGGRARAATTGRRSRAALAAMALAAWPLGLLFRVSAPEMLEGQKVINDAAYLVEQGGPAAVDLHRRRALALDRGAAGSRGALAALAAVALFALPATAQFVVKKATDAARPHAGGDGARHGRAGRGQPARRRRAAAAGGALSAGSRHPHRPARALRAVHALADAVRAGGRAGGTPRRHVFRFFRTTDPAEAMAIAQSLGARYVALYGADRVRFDSGRPSRPHPRGRGSARVPSRPLRASARQRTVGRDRRTLPEAGGLDRRGQLVGVLRADQDVLPILEDELHAAVAPDVVGAATAPPPSIAPPAVLQDRPVAPGGAGEDLLDGDGAPAQGPSRTSTSPGRTFTTSSMAESIATATRMMVALTLTGGSTRRTPARTMTVATPRTSSTTGFLMRRWRSSNRTSDREGIPASGSGIHPRGCRRLLRARQRRSCRLQRQSLGRVAIESVTSRRVSFAIRTGSSAGRKSWPQCVPGRCGPVVNDRRSSR